MKKTATILIAVVLALAAIAWAVADEINPRAEIQATRMLGENKIKVYVDYLVGEGGEKKKLTTASYIVGSKAELKTLIKRDLKQAYFYLKKTTKTDEPADKIEPGEIFELTADEKAELDPLKKQSTPPTPPAGTTTDTERAGEK